MMKPGIYKTTAINEEVKKPNIIALMFDEALGVSLTGGAMAEDVRLSFGKFGPFDPTQWEAMTVEEYEVYLNEPPADH